MSTLWAKCLCGPAMFSIGVHVSLSTHSFLNHKYHFKQLKMDRVKRTIPVLIFGIEEHEVWCYWWEKLSNMNAHQAHWVWILYGFDSSVAMPWIGQGVNFLQIIICIYQFVSCQNLGGYISLGLQSEFCSAFRPSFISV